MSYKDPQKELEFQKNYRANGRGADIVRRWRSNPENRDKEARSRRDRRRYLENRGAFLAYRRLSRLRKYGLTNDQYNEMVATQNNQCAICQKQMELPNIDHNHKTGKNRELLCRHCNTLLGMCFENAEILQRAMAYLKKHL
jgi:hypothetical protein